MNAAFVGNVVGVLRAEMVSDVDDLERHCGAWDEIAVSASQPYGAPAWVIAWWRHVAPPSAALRAILVFDGSELVAVAPLFAERAVAGSHRYRLLGSRTSSRVDLVARPGVDPEAIASAIARLLASASPSADVISFDGVARGSAWPRLLALAWPTVRLPPMRRGFTLAAPKATLAGGDFDRWYASKSRNFRQTFRRRRRQLEELGATFELLNDASTLHEEIGRFSALHRARWDRRGGSRVLTPGVERMLEEAGRRLLAENRFRLFSIRLDGRTISSHLFLSAGTRTTYWLGGFDDALAKYHPAMLGLLAALEHEFEAGTSDLDLGTGDQPYKARLADSAEYVDWVSIVPRPRFSVIAGLEYAGRRLRIDAADRLPPAAKEVARAALRAKARLGEHAPRRPGAEGGPRQRPSP